MSKQPIKFVEPDSGGDERKPNPLLRRWATAALALSLASVWIFGDYRASNFVQEIVRWIERSVS